jgi:hypothetical protein
MEMGFITIFAQGYMWGAAAAVLNSCTTFTIFSARMAVCLLQQNVFMVFRATVT